MLVVCDREDSLQDRGVCDMRCSRDFFFFFLNFTSQNALSLSLRKDFHHSYSTKNNTNSLLSKRMNPTVSVDVECNSFIEFQAFGLLRKKIIQFRSLSCSETLP